MKIFVTGAAGFIGSHLVDRLVKEGMDVVAHDNLLRGRLENIQSYIENKKINFVEGDIRSFDHLRRLMIGADIVYHLAAQSNVIGAVENMDYSFESNVLGTYNVLRAAQQNKVKRFIFTSSREVYGEPDSLPVDENCPLNAKNAYGASKVAGENYIRVFQNIGAFETVVLRLANVYGDRDFDRVIPIFIDNLKNGKNIRIFGGKQIIDFVSIETVVDALFLSKQNEKAILEPVNVGSGTGITLFNLAKSLMKLIPSKSEILIEEERYVEVQHFTAGLKRFRKVFHLPIPDDPLYFFEKMDI